MRIFRVALLLLLFALASSLPRLAAQELTSKNFDKLVELIKPTAAESSWSRIPWMLDLDAARRKAAAEGKPLFVWTMSGEPLGQC